jgi:hypothetical protein
MAEQESFVKSLPSESRFILNATMANMMDLGHGSTSPADYAERGQMYQSLRVEMASEKPKLSEISISSLGNSRLATPDEAEWTRNLSQQLCAAFKTIHVTSSSSIVLPFLPIPNQE